MGLQKYRADKVGETQSDGAVPWYTEWMGGPSLALIRNCRIARMDILPRTVYVRGEADTVFSIPAACQYKKKTIKGFISVDNDGKFSFTPYNEYLPIR